MKKYIFLTVIFALPLLFSCSAEREISERRSLMIPHLSEVPRNQQKYKEVSYDKRNNHQKKAYKRRTSYNR
jgi:hypothetical protein